MVQRCLPGRVCHKDGCWPSSHLQQPSFSQLAQRLDCLGRLSSAVHLPYHHSLQQDPSVMREFSRCLGSAGRKLPVPLDGMECLWLERRCAVKCVHH